jgi:hypothetical protein
MKFFKIALIILIAAAVLPTAALALRIWDPLWNPFRPSPEEVVGKTVDKMQELNSFSYDVSADSQNTGDETISGFSLKAEGDIDDNKSSTVSDVNFNVQGVSLDFGIEYRGLENESYYKITKMPDIPSITQAISGKENQWIKRENGAESGQMESARELLQDKDLYIVQEELKDDRINGEPVYHYKLRLSKEKINKALDDYSSAEPEQVLDVGSIAVESFKEKIDDTDIDVWIGKKDYYVYRIKMQSDAGNFEISLSNFNQAFDIEAPESYGN